MNSSAELTPVERLLNVCSLCLSPPMIMQIPWEQHQANTRPSHDKGLGPQEEEKKTSQGGDFDLSFHFEFEAVSQLHSLPSSQSAVRGEVNASWLTGMKRMHPSSVPVRADLTISCRHGLPA